MAKFETKFDVGQEVYVINCGDIHKCIVKEIKISSYVNGQLGLQTYINYLANGCYAERDVFATKEEAIIKWLESQNVDMLIIKGAIK